MSQLLLAVILMRMSVRTETDRNSLVLGSSPLLLLDFTSAVIAAVLYTNTHTCQRSTHVKPLIHMAGLYIKHGRFEEQSSADGTPNS